MLDHIQRQQAEIKEEERLRWHIEIGDMWCPSCAEVIRLMLLKERGVVNCVVDYATDLASIEFAPRYCSKEKISQIITELGYRQIPLDSVDRKAVSFSLYMRFAIATFCALNAMMFAYPLYATYFSYDGEGYGNLFAWLSFAASVPVITYSAWPIWKRLLISLKTGFFGMETLVAIGVTAAGVISVQELFSGGTKVYFDSMTVIIVFVLLGKIIEARAKFSAKESLMRLTRSTPKRGRKRLDDNTVRFVTVKEIIKGDTLIVYSGEKLPLDGVIITGQGSCDESLMTGEAMPVAKKIGDGVLGGTLLVQGYLEIKVSSSAEESTMQKIIEMVERDIGHKSAYVRKADLVVRWFVPTVIVIAALAGLLYWINPKPNDVAPFETAWLRSLAVLLISCPCAIGIAVPAAESYLLNALAELGVIIRNRGCLPFLGNETAMVFDKTGTVTEGRFAVCAGLEKLNKEELCSLHHLASHSIHPVACAIAAATATANTLQSPLKKLEEIAGYGLRGEYDDQHLCLGSSRFFNQQGITISNDPPEKIEGTISYVYFAINKRCVAKIALSDKIRPEIKEVTNALKGKVTTILLSGDSESSVAAIAKLGGFDAWKSNCTPLEKRNFIDNLRKQGLIVCMIGDGINDAPALTTAQVGISVVTATDMSIQVSDLLLTSDRLSILIKMRALARRGQKIVRQNLFWAFFYNVIGIFLAFFGWLSPIFAAFAMSISSLTVLFNSRRLRSVK